MGSVPLHRPVDRQVNSELPLMVYPELHENCTRVFTVVAVVDLEPLGGVFSDLHDVNAANIRHFLLNAQVNSEEVGIEKIVKNQFYKNTFYSQ